jgi:hypothetical protein
MSDVNATRSVRFGKSVEIRHSELTIVTAVRSIGGGVELHFQANSYPRAALPPMATVRPINGPQYGDLEPDPAERATRFEESTVTSQDSMQRDRFESAGQK